MSGDTGQTSQAQQTFTAPWAEAMPTLGGILGQVNNQLPNTGLNENEQIGLARMSQQGMQGNQYRGQLGNYATELLSGVGGEGIQKNYHDYNRRLSGIADGHNLGPGGNPMLQKYLGVIGDDVQNRVNSMFAGAGRDLSGMNQQTLARGIGQATAPILAQQYNTDFGNMRSAADALFAGGNTEQGLMHGLRQSGVGVADAANTANSQGPQQILAAEAARRNIPINTLGLLAQIGIPVAGLGGTAFGTGTGQQSTAQQFGLFGSAANNFLNPIKWLTG